MLTSDSIRLVLAWLGTYLLHSTLFLGLAWVFFRLSARRAPGLVDRVWKLAVVGGVVTASLQLAVGSRPILGQLTLPTADEPGRVAAATETVEATSPAVAPRRNTTRTDLLPTTTASTPLPPADAARRIGAADPDLPRPVTSRRALARETDGERRRAPRFAGARNPDTDLARLEADAEGHPVARLAPPTGTTVASPPSKPGAAGLALRRAGEVLRTMSIPWRSALFVAWGVLGGAGLLGILFAWSRISRLLTGRREIVAGELHARFVALVRQSGIRGHVRLTAAPSLDCPITRGFLRREVCVPLRVLTDLSPAQQDSLLAHELAHAKRRDPLWFFAVALLERLLFFQPLNRLARRRLHEVAELLCDDCAVRWTGQRLALASCLTEIAGWLVGKRPLALPTPSIAGSSRLGERVERLLDDEHTTAPEPHRPWWSPTACIALSVFVFAVPGVSSTPGPEPAATRPLAAPPVTPALRAILVEGEVIDAHLDLLEGEIPVLRAELAESGHLPQYAGALASIDHRVKKLRELDRRRQALLARLQSRPAHPTAPHPIPDH